MFSSGSARSLWIEIGMLSTARTPEQSGSARSLWIEIYTLLYNPPIQLSGSARSLWIEMNLTTGLGYDRMVGLREEPVD